MRHLIAKIETLSPKTLNILYLVAVASMIFLILLMSVEEQIKINKEQTMKNTELEQVILNHWRSDRGSDTARYNYIALHQNVLLVIVVDIAIKSYEVYIGSVPGISHKLECSIVRNYGDPVDEKIAIVIFPIIEDLIELGYCKGES